MTVTNAQDVPRLTVVGSGGGSQAPAPWREALLDGTAVIGTGGVIAGGFVVEASKSLMTGEADGRWWFVLGSLVGLALIGVGFWMRERAKHRVQVGIVVTAADARRGIPAGRRSDESAESYSLGLYPLTLKTHVVVPDAGPGTKGLVDALVDETLTAATIAERLSPHAYCINLIPTMPLHLAFYFGARLGYTHTREILVHSIRTANGSAGYFPATSLAVTETETLPLIVDRLEVLEGGDPGTVALALDLQARGDQFFAPVRQTCREKGIGYLLAVRNPNAVLTPDRETFAGAVEQICRAWRDAPLPAAARTGQHSVFLSGPVALSLTLGARLANTDLSRWTAYSFDSATSTYEPFPPRAST